MSAGNPGNNNKYSYKHLSLNNKYSSIIKKTNNYNRMFNSLLTPEDRERRNREERIKRERNSKKKDINNKLVLIESYLLLINQEGRFRGIETKNKIDELKRFIGCDIYFTISLILNNLLKRSRITPDIFNKISIFLFKFITELNPHIRNFEINDLLFVNASFKYNLGDFNLIPANEGVCYQSRLLEYILKNEPSFYIEFENSAFSIELNKNSINNKQSIWFGLPYVVKYLGIETSSPAIDVGGISQIFYEQIQDELNKINFLTGNLNYLKNSYNEYPIKIKVPKGRERGVLKINNLEELNTIINRNEDGLKKKDILKILHIINTIFLCSMSVYNKSEIYDIYGRKVGEKKFVINLSENSEFYKYIMYQFYLSKFNEQTSNIDLTSFTNEEFSNLFCYFLVYHNSPEEMYKLFNTEQRKQILQGNANINIPSYDERIKEFATIPLLNNTALSNILDIYGYPSIETFINLHMTPVNVSIENKDTIKENINIISTSLTPQKKNKIKDAFNRFIDLLNQKELDIFCSYITGTRKLTNYNIKISDIDPNVVQTNSSGRPIFKTPFASHTCFNTLDLNINISTARNNNELEELVFNYLTRPKTVNNGNSEIRYQLIYAFSKSENFGLA